MLRLTINNVEIPLADNAGLSINKELYDPIKPSSRKSDYSKTFTVAGTPVVNKLFGHIFALDQRILTAAGTQFNPDYNPNIKAPAKLDIDGVPIIHGFARLTEINVNEFNDVEYSMTIFSPAADFFTAIRDKKLSELDFSDLNHVLNTTNIINSWDTSYKRGGADQAFALGEGYVYPLVLREPQTQFAGALLEDMRPALFLKEVTDKIISDAGFTYDASSFITATEFKRLTVLPLENSFDVGSAAMDAEEFLAEATTTLNLTPGTILKFNNDSTGGNFDTPGKYNNATYKYTTNYGGYYSFRFVGDLGMVNTSGHELTVWMGIYVDGVPTSLVPINYSVGSSIKSVDQDFTVLVKAGSVVDLRLNAVTYLSQAVGAGWVLTEFSGSTFTGTIASAAQGSGQTLNFSQFFKSDMTQEKFFAGICKMFNLHIITDINSPKELKIIADKDLYTTTVMSLHDKLDHSKEITSVPMGELTASEYVFKYKAASDPESIEIAQAYTDPYGSYRYKVDNDLVTEVTEVELPFVSTPFAPGINNGMCLPYLSAKPKNDEFHILIYGGLKSCTNSWSIFTNAYGAQTAITVGYPFFGHIDDPYNPTYDICFGMPPIINLPSAGRVTYTNNNLFNAYWRRWMVQITDINSRVVTAYFRLKPIDWYNISFDKIYQFEGQNFRLLKIDDYDPTGLEVTKITFLRIVQEVAFVATTKKKGRGYDNTDGYGDKFPMDRVPKTKWNQVFDGGTVYGDTIIRGEGNNGQSMKHVIFGNGNTTTGDGQVIILGGNGIKGSERCVSILEDNEERGEGLFIHGTEVDLSAVTDGYVLKYVAALDKWVGMPALF